MTYTKLTWQRAIGMMVFMNEMQYLICILEVCHLRGYAVFNGLKRVIQFIEHFHFSDSDIEYLQSIGYKNDFLNYLKI